MYDEMLLATDGSDVAQQAGTLAVAVADQFNATLHIISVVDTGKTESGEEHVQRTVDVADEAGVETRTDVIESIENVSAEILGYANKHTVEAIVMGTQGRSGVSRFILGSVAMQTMQNATIPVITVHEDSDTTFHAENILVPTDGSSGAAIAVEQAIDLALETGATLHALYITDDPEAVADDSPAHDAAERAQTAGVEEVEVVVRDGRPYLEIAGYISEAPCDLVVMGTHGMTGLRRYVLGSTTERVTQFSTVPVVTVRPHEAAATVEFLNYDAIQEQGWSLEDPDLFEKAQTELDGEDAGSINVDEDEYILDAAEAAGYDWPYHCRAGGCVNCAAILIEGEVDMERCRSLSDEEIDEEDLRLTCVATPTSEDIRLVYNAKGLESLQDRVF